MHTSVEYELYKINRTYEWQTIKGATNIVAATSEGVGDALDDFFEKYGEDHTDLRKGDDKK
ncbi:TPA: hypothetical protein ROY23_000485 [Bacillus wiedmannii]|uniref:hypothetical protein n=1 Tax=Bacillus cereus TaxID=1396 RepID=UPI0007FB3835|nr:hypothetical protein [Bacillus cereus]OBW57625.1 hypothetical protein A9987_02095 [Bacillus cereus]HDX9650093.1 hypothetical protein [Bacillus wiedmannii]